MIDLYENSMFVCGSKINSATGNIILTVKFDSLSIEFNHCHLANILLRIDHYHDQCIKTALRTKQITLLPNIKNEHILNDMKNAVIALHSIESNPPTLTITILSTFIMFKGRYFLDHRLKSPNINLEYQIFETM